MGYEEILKIMIRQYLESYDLGLTNISYYIKNSQPDDALAEVKILQKRSKLLIKGSVAIHHFYHIDETEIDAQNAFNNQFKNLGRIFTDLNNDLERIYSDLTR